MFYTILEKVKKHDSSKWREEHDILHEILLMSISTRSLLKLDIIAQNYLYEYVDKYSSLHFSIIIIYIKNCLCL